MIFIWLFLLGWSHFISGHFSAIEITMTLIIGVASIVGLIQCVWRPRWNWFRAVIVLIFAVFQLAAFRISLLPQIANQ